jgi:hypothetical protein
MTTTTQQARETALANDQAKLATAQSTTTTKSARSNAAKRSSAPRTTTKTSAAKRSSAPRTASKTAPKTTKTASKTKTTKTTGPSDRTMRRDVTAHLIKVTVDAYLSLPVKTVKGVKYVTVNGTEIPRTVAHIAVKQLLGYTAPDLWDSRLGPRDVGRPVSTKSAA